MNGRPERPAIIFKIPFALKGKWDLEIVWFCVHYYYPIPQKGMGSCCCPVCVYTIIIPSPIRGWDSVVVRFHLHYYYNYPIPQKGMGSCSSLVSCTLGSNHYFLISPLDL